MRKKLSGRVLSLIMAVVFLIGVLPAAAAARADEPSVTPIGEARKCTPGQTVTVEGIAMTCTPAENPDLAFADCIYVQDETGGVRVVGFDAGMKIKAGQEVRVTGVVREYFADREIEVADAEDVVVTNEKVDPWYKYNMTNYIFSDLLLDPTNNGWYTYDIGLVSRIEKDVTGKIQSFWLRPFSDFGSEYTEVRIFIDGYIGYSKQDSTFIEAFVTVGEAIYARGFVSTDLDGQRIRVSDRSDIGVTTVWYPPTMTTTTIVEGLSAYLSIQINGYNLHLAKYHFIKLQGDSGYTSELIPVVPGANRVFIPVAPPAGNYRVQYFSDGAFDDIIEYSAPIPITVLPYEPEKLWNPLKADADGFLAVRFAAPVKINEGKFSVTVDGKAVAASLAADGVTLVTDLSFSDFAGSAVIVRGIAYPQHFPSYSLTFTVKNCEE